MIYGYIRVSSDKQTVENQRFEINNFCERYKLVIDGWIEETISGMKSTINVNWVGFYYRFRKMISLSVQNYHDWEEIYS